MRRLTLCCAAVAMWACVTSGADIAPITMVHTATSQQVYVACFWARQFPRFADSSKHLLIACPRATWLAANPTKRQLVLTAIRKWLAGDEPVSAARLVTLRDALADANVRVVLTDDPEGQLKAWGLRPATLTEDTR